MTTTTTLNLTEDAAFELVRGLLLGNIPEPIEIIQGQENRVPQPQTDDFIVMTSLSRSRITTNISSYTDGSHLPVPTSETSKHILQPTQMTIQLDIHGPNAFDNATLVSALMCDEVAVLYFERSDYDIRPLYADDPRQMPFVNAEDQYENRWTIDCVLQMNTIVTVFQDFADKVSIKPIPADAVYLVA